MYPYEALDDVPDEVWNIIDSFFEKDNGCEDNVNISIIKNNT